MKVQLFSTKTGLKSNSLKRLALALSAALGYKVWRTSAVKPNRLQFRYGDAVDKLAQYKFFKEKGISALEFTTKGQEAVQWLNEGHTVFGRKLLNASCGKGIEVYEPKDVAEIDPCPVYTKYKPKKREFRVHVFKDKVVTIVEKKRKSDYQGDKKDAKIRNLEHGYVFAQQIELADSLRQRIEEVALRASKVCSSDFRGVDIAYNEKKDDVFVIEVNSAPGIEGSNVDKYVAAIVKHVKGK
jgi:hypothetical protein